MVLQAGLPDRHADGLRRGFHRRRHVPIKPTTSTQDPCSWATSPAIGSENTLSFAHWSSRITIWRTWPFRKAPDTGLLSDTLQRSISRMVAPMAAERHRHGQWHFARAAMPPSQCQGAEIAMC
ncbi:hypothetical protein ACN47E_002762 [Coniothyrium glycines]